MIAQLKARLQAPLPGMQVQYEMSIKPFPVQQWEEILVNLPENVRKAAVTILLFKENNQWFTYLMQRPTRGLMHSGEVSLPGGGVEAQDENMQATAAREMQEEFGINPQEVEYLGQLSPIYIPVSNSFVQPFVAYYKANTIEFSPDAHEVVEILPTPLQWLFEKDRIKTTEIVRANGMRLKDVPYFDMHNRVVWGATAMMLQEFKHCLEKEWIFEQMP